MDETIKELTQIDNPEKYHSAVHLYQVGHSMLLIQADRGKEFGTDRWLYLTFINVVYYEGPLQWKGIGFSFGTLDECAEILEQIGMDKEIFEIYNLFKTEAKKTHVKIVASRAFITQSIPPDFAKFIQRDG